MTLADSAYIEARVHFDSLADVADAYAERTGRDWVEVQDAMIAQICRLKWFSETVGFNHQSWARFNFQTTRPEVAARRIRETQEKIARIAARYMERP